MIKRKNGNTMFQYGELKEITLSELIALLKKAEPEHGDRKVMIEWCDCAEFCVGVDIRSDDSRLEPAGVVLMRETGVFSSYDGWENKVDLDE